MDNCANLVKFVIQFFELILIGIMMNKSKLSILLILAVIISACGLNSDSSREIQKGNVIFIHPDGTGLAVWNALRILEKGPDGEINWDKLQDIGLYKSHTSSSYSFGMDRESELTARSGKKMSIMQEAMEAGISTGIVNSGSIVEPGTAVFLASETSRELDESITKKVLESGAEVILSGGEEWMLPEGTTGRHGKGKRTDGLDLVAAAKENGYTIVYNREELLSVADNTEKLLGIFAEGHTFNDKSEELLTEMDLPNFDPSAPSLSEMTMAAIKILSKKEQFFLVVEEEATDNFGNKNNANGMLEALSRADEAIGNAINFADDNKNTLLIVASDSEAGGMEVVGNGGRDIDFETSLPEKDRNGAPIDGRSGTATHPFISQPDQFGNRFPFGILWSTRSDTYGGVVVRSTGTNSFLTKGLVDNTDIYRIMYSALFGKLID
jgi:alkaline phosphatase